MDGHGFAISYHGTLRLLAFVLGAWYQIAFQAQTYRSPAQVSMFLALFGIVVCPGVRLLGSKFACDATLAPDLASCQVGAKRHSALGCN